MCLAWRSQPWRQTCPKHNVKRVSVERTTRNSSRRDKPHEEESAHWPRLHPSLLVRQYPCWSLLSHQPSLNYILQNRQVTSVKCMLHLKSLKCRTLTKKFKCRTPTMAFIIYSQPWLHWDQRSSNTSNLPLAEGEEAAFPPRLPQQTPDVGRKVFTENRRELGTDLHVYRSLIYYQGDLAGQREGDRLVKQEYVIIGDPYESHE